MRNRHHSHSLLQLSAGLRPSGDHHPELLLPEHQSSSDIARSRGKFTSFRGSYKGEDIRKDGEISGQRYQRKGRPRGSQCLM
jgi:hypothetical protein